MATFINIMEQSKDILAEIFDKSDGAEQQRQEEYHHAVVIQAWYRGCRSRRYLSELNEMAIKMQRVWRGYSARKVWREMVATEVDKLKSTHYNGMATRIQRAWHGFFSRKYIHDFYALKAYLRGIEEKNEEQRRQANEAWERENNRLLAVQEEEGHNRLLADAKSKHHLISTLTIPGVFNNPNRHQPEEMEYRLKAVTPLVASEKMTADVKSAKEKRKCDQKQIKFPPLPPHPQGPFKDQKKVFIQRHKSLSPSLRVQSSFFSQMEARQTMAAEEWVHRIHDDRFDHVGVIDQPYQPLHHTTTPFGKIPYGTLHFRDCESKKWIVSEDFKQLVPPIPVFDKFNKSYDDHCHHCST